MICDSIENVNQYTGIHSGVVQVLELMKDYTPDNFPEGRISIAGDSLYMNFVNYETRSCNEAMLESHKKYIDVMYVVEGSEIIYVKPVTELQNITKPYDQVTDLMFGDVDSDATPVRLVPGRFVVLFPQDAHAPGCFEVSSEKVKKIVGKVQI